MDKKIPKEKTGFNKLPEAVQEQISPKLAKSLTWAEEWLTNDHLLWVVV